MRLLSIPATLAGASLLSACGASAPASTDPYADKVAVQNRLRQTLADLAGLGEKRAGTEAGWQAGEYVRARFEAAGLEDVGFESFSFPSYERLGSSLEVTVDGTPLAAAHEVFAYSGVGSVAGAVVDVGKGHASAYADTEAAGKVVLVTRDPTFHRSSQYRLVIEHSGLAMLYVSQSPDNLIQVGTVADPEDGIAPIPAVTVGADDGAAIANALSAGKTVTAAIAVDATLAPGAGRNVLGRLPGASPEAPFLLVGAHYDTWYSGSIDNGTGVAAVVEVAEALAHRPGRNYGVTFVGYDGEELGLFGGYDLLRDHVVAGEEPLLAFVNFEMPAAEEGGLRAVACSGAGPMDAALRGAGLKEIYTMMVGLEVVPALFGGVIPTDIQGLYWHGLQGMSTACDSAYYHTPADTPDKVDLGLLADAVLAAQRALAFLDRAAAGEYAQHDPAVWRIEASTGALADGLGVDVTVTDADGKAQKDAAVQIWLDVDDFTRAFQVATVTDADGQASATIPTAALSAGDGGRWLHVTAGEDYPLAERVLSLP